MLHNHTLKISFFVTTLFTISLFLAACGSGGSGFDSAFVEDLRVDPDSITVGADATVIVEFEPNTITEEEDDTESVEDTEVVILLPPGVDYIDGSSEFDGSIVDGFDPRPPNTVELCGDGSRALTYSLSSGELSNLGDNRIRIKAKAFEVRGAVTFIAEAGQFIVTPCGIAGTDSDDLLILP